MSMTEPKPTAATMGTSPTARSGTPQASPIATLIVETANARARWVAIDEEYDHKRALLELELLDQLPTKYTTDVAQRVWLDGQLHQNAQFEQISEQRLAAYRDYCLQQAQVDANKVAFEERYVAAFDGTGSSVFAGIGQGLHTHGDGTSTVSPMDKPGGGFRGT